MKKNSRTLLFMSLVSIPAAFLLYFVAKWSIAEIAIIFVIQTIYYITILRRQEKFKKKQ